ncbi:hypothetical protein BC751_2614 [Cecembia calidifontis]|jgi:hypothetical protein|uniref:Uncharacterized protein n=1 Tax=Cecembia calidifontis TaxID=1187080 RepID=A0A4Q7PAM9_9BACT|nr:hypothetical protein BC751_2614 [Cecembia calidifontis]
MAMSAPRMAAGDSFDRQPTSFDNTMLHDSFFGIVTAGGRIPASGWE